MKSLLLIVAALAIGGCAVFQHHSYTALSLGIGDWRLIEVGGRTVAPADMRRRPWLHFAPDSGRVIGSGGCNRLSGPITIDGPSLHFGALAMTRMACADPYMNQQEVWFTDALNETDRYAVIGDTLILYGGGETKAKLGR
jgi:heat shock protein HslJ